MTNSKVDTLLPPSRRLSVAIFAALFGFVVLVFMLALVWDPKVPSELNGLLFSLGLLFALTLWVLAYVVSRYSGGLYLDSERQALGIGVTGKKDIWWLPLSSLSHFAIGEESPSTPEGPPRFALHLVQKESPLSLLLLQGDDRPFLEGMGEQLGARLGLTLNAEAIPTVSPQKNRELRFQVQKKPALQSLKALLGLSLFTFGTIAALKVQASPSLGIVFAPPALFFGALLAVMALFKRFTSDVLVENPEAFCQHFAIASFKWGQKTIARNAEIRLRPMGLRGMVLEFVAGGRILLLASGATTLSSMSLATIAEVIRDEFPSFTIPPSHSD